MPAPAPAANKRRSVVAARNGPLACVEGLRSHNDGNAVFNFWPAREEAIMATPAETQNVIRSLIPARIDRLPWSPFHTRMVIALGVAWILDGLDHRG